MAPRLSLRRQQHPLASSSAQLQVLQPADRFALFSATLAAQQLPPLRSSAIEVLQVNLGKLCNQTCRHCHVDAGPDRREIMDESTIEACLAALKLAEIPTLDLTGGAPEMNPQFRSFVARARSLGCRIIDRCNLTILMAPGYEDLPEFLAEHGVEIVASLPCYLPENTDFQRGEGVFAKSIEALRRLNQLGYGCQDSDLVLTLVYNPLGPKLPPPQANLEAGYRRELLQRYGISFNRLFTITNMPISRFLADLTESGQYEPYMKLLIASFNPATTNALMCRTTLSVGWDGRLYDCDFNQMLDMELGSAYPKHIRDFDPAKLRDRPIVVGQHCYGCTAGSGSSCQGQTAGQKRYANTGNTECKVKNEK